MNAGRPTSVSTVVTNDGVVGAGGRTVGRHRRTDDEEEGDRVREEPAGAVVAGLGDEDEVHAAYLLYGPELYRFVLRGLGDPGAAQDVTQETFLKAWRFADRYDPDLASLRVWLFGIARNTMIDHARAAQARPWQRHLLDPPTAQELGGAVADPADGILREWLVEEALRRLSEHHREAIVQTYLKERPYDEVAAELGVPVGTLRSRVFYGLRALRSAMDEMGVTL